MFILCLTNIASRKITLYSGYKDRLKDDDYLSVQGGHHILLRFLQIVETMEGKRVQAHLQGNPDFLWTVRTHQSHVQNYVEPCTAQVSRYLVLTQSVMITFVRDTK